MSIFYDISEMTTFCFYSLNFLAIIFAYYARAYVINPSTAYRPKLDIDVRLDCFYLATEFVYIVHFQTSY